MKHLLAGYLITVAILVFANAASCIYLYAMGGTLKNAREGKPALDLASAIAVIAIVSSIWPVAFAYLFWRAHNGDSKVFGNDNWNMPS